MKHLNQLLALGLSLFAVQNAHATQLFSDGFGYTSGTTLGNGLNGAWAGGSSSITIGTGNLTYPGLLDMGGNDVLVTSGSAGTTKANFTATPITSGSVYVSFLAECTTLPSANNYVFSVVNSGAGPSGSADPIAVYVGQYTGVSAFKIGVRHTGVGTGATYTPNTSQYNNLFTAGAVNLFVVKYTFNPSTADDTVSLFVDPTPGGAEPTADVTVPTGGTDAANLQVVGFKANSATTAGNWVFDSVTVGDTWADVVPVPEPSTFALAGLGIFGLALWRRARR